MQTQRRLKESWLFQKVSRAVKPSARLREREVRDAAQLSNKRRDSIIPRYRVGVGRQGEDIKPVVKMETFQLIIQKCSEPLEIIKNNCIPTSLIEEMDNFIYTYNLPSWNH